MARPPAGIVVGLDRLLQKLQKRLIAAMAKPVVKVGYSAHYAIYVHENMERKLIGQPRPSGLGTYWSPGGEQGSKFLERPAREMQTALKQIVANAARRGATLAQALYMAGLALQAESMRRTPVEFGTLRASAFTRLERG